MKKFKIIEKDNPNKGSVFEANENRGWVKTLLDRKAIVEVGDSEKGDIKEYEIVKGVGKGRTITVRSNKGWIKKMLAKGTVVELKEEKQAPETKELKHKRQTK